ncbi:hypothetical protein ACLPJK_25640 [Pseudomonas aeruginosa]|uniref:DUF7941 domain-family protein n=1 Tax=Pseudomonas aeruginosa TaxID=287 RepID=UPI003D2B42FF
MRINPSSSAAANLVQLISTSNADKPLTADQVTFGVPAASSQGTANTQVVVTAVEGQGYKDSQTFHYVRLDLATDASYEGVVAELTDVSEEATAGELLSFAVAQLGFVASEVEAGTLTAVDGATDGSLVINAKADSLVYTGTVTVVLKPVDTTESLATAFPTDELTGFESPELV